MNKWIFMKKLLFLALLLTCQMTLASSLEGRFKVMRGCLANNIRLSVLNLMYTEGAEVSIELDQENKLILFSSYHADSAALPLSSKSELKPIIFKNYFKNAEIQFNANSYALKTKGNELQKCDNYPLPGSHPCLGKWNDGITLQVNSAGNLEIQWKIEKASGTCSLERL